MPSDLITTADLRKHVESGLDDDALDQLISAADADILRYVGEHDPATTMTVELDSSGYRVYLPRPAESVAVVETRYYPTSGWLTREIDSYELINGGRVLQSLSYVSFYDRVRVEYTPVATNPQRMFALIQLVRLATHAFTGLASEGDDIYNVVHLDHGKERARILRTLRQSYGGAGLLR